MTVLERAGADADSVVVLTPVSVEARAVRAGAPWARVQRTGMGHRRAARSVALAEDDLPPARAVLIAGFCSALNSSLAPGDVVLASELRRSSGDPVGCADPSILAGVLRRGGMRVHVGPIASAERMVRGERRRELARTGALAVDMESAWLTHVVATAQEVTELTLSDPERVAYLTQTTLAVEETAEVVGALTDRFPAAVGPPSSDICYATQNRQDAVRALAAECDLIVVVGSENSSNSRRLVEVAERAGCRACLVEGAVEIPPLALAGARRVGITAGASAPESLVADVVAAIGGLGTVEVTEHRVATETVQFRLPREVRPQRG